MFDIAQCARYVESLIRHDEIERALLVLDNVPAIYRMNPPVELERLRTQILQFISITPYRYTVSTGDECVESDADAVATLRHNIRGRILEKYVRDMNDHGITPHVVDYGPGPYVMPRALKHLGLKFTYWDLAINERAKVKYRPGLAAHLDENAGKRGAPTIFLALEVIEHLHNPIDLATEAVRNAERFPEIVMLSTPFCTYDPIPENENWRTRTMEHLRAYTPQEFGREAARIFPGYTWEMSLNEPPWAQPMSLVGARRTLTEGKPK